MASQIITLVRTLLGSVYGRVNGREPLPALEAGPEALLLRLIWWLVVRIAPGSRRDRLFVRDRQGFQWQCSRSGSR